MWQGRCFDVLNLRRYFMFQNVYEVTEIFDPLLPPRDFADYEIVFWFSRHRLTEGQKEALYFLHKKRVRIFHRPVTYAGPEDFVRLLKYHSPFGTIYTVASSEYYDLAKKENCTFRYFEGYIDRKTEEFCLNRVNQCNDGYYRQILSRVELIKMSGRPVLPALSTR